MGLLVYSVFVDASAAANDDNEHEDGVVNISLTYHFIPPHGECVLDVARCSYIQAFTSNNIARDISATTQSLN